MSNVADNANSSVESVALSNNITDLTCRDDLIYINKTETVVNESGNSDLPVLNDTDISTAKTVSSLGYCSYVWIEITDKYCKGYEVYVDGVYQFTEGEDSVPEGYCRFKVTPGYHTFKLTLNGKEVSKGWNCQCGTGYNWMSMNDMIPHWCEGGGNDNPTDEYEVKFRGTVTSTTPSEYDCGFKDVYICEVKIEKVVSGDYFEKGDIVNIVYSQWRENAHVCGTYDKVSAGDTVEVYGEMIPIYCVGTWITICGKSSYYLKKISSESLSISVWTDKNEYKIGETVTINYQTNKKCTAKLTITKPDGGDVVYGPNEIPASTRSKSATAGYPTGKRTVVFEAWAGAEYKKATCYFDVVEEKKSDLIIKDISWSPSSPDKGDTIKFTVKIKNQGSGSGGSSTVKYYVDGSYVDYDSVPALSAGSTSTQTFTWTANKCGNVQVKTVADANNAVDEGSNDGNNDRSETINVICGEKPAPEIIKVSYPTTCVKEGDDATISVTVGNKGGTSNEGYISVSFPNDEDVSVVSGTGNGYNKLYPKGSEIWGKDGKIPSSKDPLVDLLDTSWVKDQQETITMNVKPNSGSDEIVFYVRAALKNADGSYERDPTYSGDKDQQGWYAKKYSVDVCGVEEVKFRGELLADHPIISFYSFDVKIDTVLDDPTGNLQKGETVNVYGHRSGPAQVDDVTVGDNVEVFGDYRGYVGTYEQIFLSDWDESSSDHYVKKIEEPDLIIQEISWSPSNPKVGDTVTFTVKIKNQGTGDATAFHVYYYIDGTYHDTDTIYGLSAGSTTTQSFTWSADKSENVQIKAVADATNAVDEWSNEGNNELIKTMAEGKSKKVLFDTAHNEWWTIDNYNEKMGVCYSTGRYATFADILKNAGYEITEFNFKNLYSEYPSGVLLHKHILESVQLGDSNKILTYTVSIPKGTRSIGISLNSIKETEEFAYITFCDPNGKKYFSGRADWYNCDASSHVHDPVAGAWQLKVELGDPTRDMWAEYDFKIDIGTVPTLKQELENNDYDVLIMGAPREFFQPSEKDFSKLTDEEIDAIVTYVNSGGNLLLIGMPYPAGYGSISGGIAKGFNTKIIDKWGSWDDVDQNPKYKVTKSDMKNHQIFNNINEFYYYRWDMDLGRWTWNILETSNTVAYADGDPIIAAFQDGGRVVIIGSGDTFENDNIDELDHRQLAINIMDWLSLSESGSDKPDLIIEKVSWSIFIKAGEPFNFNVDISNIGSGDAEDFYVGYYIGSMYLEDHIEILSAGSTISKEYTISLKECGEVSFKGIADVKNDVDENKLNNIKEDTIHISCKTPILNEDDIKIENNFDGKTPQYIHGSLMSIDDIMKGALDYAFPFKTNLGEDGLYIDATINVKFENHEDIQVVKLIGEFEPIGEGKLNIDEALFNYKSDGFYSIRIGIFNKAQRNARFFNDIIALLSLKGNIPPLPELQADPKTFVPIKLQSIIAELYDGTIVTFEINRNLPYFSESTTFPVCRRAENGNCVSYVMYAASPVNLLVVDDIGRKIGTENTDTSYLEFHEIPNAIYSGDAQPEYIILTTKTNYSVYIQAVDVGKFDFTLMQYTKAKKLIIIYKDVPILATTVATVDVSQENPIYTMKIDKYGDGTTIETKKPDSIETDGQDAYSIRLHTGWNLISLPLMPDDIDILDVMNSLDGNWNTVWSYEAGNWKRYDLTGPDFLNDLTTIEPGKGYWIDMKSEDTLSVSGSEQPTTKSISLSAGWNLVGYNSLSSMSTTEAMNSVDGNWNSVWSYENGNWKRYDLNGPDFLNDLTTIEPGKGYWIDMKSPDTWSLGA